MNTDTKHIGIACFLGGALGALIALQFGHYFWWFGVLLGGAIGYTSYRYQEVWKATRAVCIWAGEEMIKERVLPQIAWGKVFTSALNFCWEKCLLPIFAFILYALSVLAISTSWWLVLYTFQRSEHTIFAITLLGAIAFFLEWLEISNGSNMTRDLLYYSKRNLWFTSPVAIGILLWGLAKFSIWFVPRSPMLTKKLFLLIHSEIRLLCLADSIIGATAGYFLGSPLIGGITGAVFSILNYEIVVRRLRLVTAPGKSGPD